MGYYEQIQLLKDSLKGYSEEESRLADLYKTAVKNAEDAHKRAKEQREKQYYFDRNQAAADSMQQEHNANQFLAARGLGFSGEAAQAKLNANVNLSNRLGEINRNKHQDDINADIKLADDKLKLDSEKAQQIKNLLETKIKVNTDIAKLEFDREQAETDRKQAEKLKDKELAAKKELLNIELNNKNGGSGGSSGGSGSNKPIEEEVLDDGTYIPELSAAQLAQRVISGAEGGNGEAKEYAINKFLLELNNNYNINQDYYKELLLTLKAYGYEEISLPFMRCQVAGYESKSVYTKTYDTQLDILIEEGASPAEARKQAEAAAKRAQMDYILEHVKSLLEFRKACNDVGITNAEVNQYRREVLNLER
ncbi:MAG: hypothetical protein IKZ23_03305 [Clostridia bacterium]|nr:hypothetical protein [Clostridia bacterium]